MYKVESDFMYKEHRCVVVFQDLGHRCGYVSVGKSSLLWNKSFSDYLDIKKTELENSNIGKRGVISLLISACDNDERISISSYFDVHGGITYSSGGVGSKYPVESDLYWFGFDCAHCYDSIDCEKLLEYFPDEKFTKSRIENAIFFEDAEVRTLEYVEQECKNLVNQIEEVETLLKSKNRN